MKSHSSHTPDASEGAQNARPGVLLVTHGDYGRSLLAAAEMILGPQSHARSVGVESTESMDETLATIKRSVEELDTGMGVLILTDMFGGTPTNLSLSLLSVDGLEVVTGVNLPMLLKSLGSTEAPRDAACDIRTAGTQGIVVAGEILRKKVCEE